MSDYSPGRIRKLLRDAFSDEEFTFFCYDNFREVYNKFSAGMTASSKIQLLIEYCETRNLYKDMLVLVKGANPAKYAEYESGQGGANQPAPVVATPPSQPRPESQPVSTVVDNSGERPNVFISYSRRDLDFVTQLHQELTNRSVSAWFDKENIEVGDQWAAAIVEGIRDCKVFLLVLSPDSAASKNVRKEVDLAQRYDKPIVPLVWRETQIPVAMEYQLAGIQWMDFKQTSSVENFNQLADILRRLIGGASLAEATNNTSIAKDALIPPIQKEEPAKVSSGKLGGLKKISTIDPIALQGLVISSLVTSFDLDTEDQDRVNIELQWLFHATDNLMKIRNGQAAANQPIAVAIPPQAEKKDHKANNCILNPSFPAAFSGQIEALFKRIKTHLDNLDVLLLREVQLGEAAKENLGLQTEIKGKRIGIVTELQTLAQLMRQAYGILVTSPGQLGELLGA